MVAAFFALTGFGEEAALVAVLTDFLVVEALGRKEALAEVFLALVLTGAAFVRVDFLVMTFLAVALANGFLAAASFFAGFAARVVEVLAAGCLIEAGFTGLAGIFFFGGAFDAAVFETALFTDAARFADAFAVAAFFGAALADFDCALPDAALVAGLVADWAGDFAVLVLLTTTSGGKRLQHVVSSKRRIAPAFTRRRSQVKGFEAAS